jgi:hypothetical protein
VAITSERGLLGIAVMNEVAIIIQTL